MFSIMKNGHFGQKFQTIKTEQGNKEAEFLFSGLYGGQDFPGKGEKYEKKATEKMDLQLWSFCCWYVSAADGFRQQEETR